MEQCEVSVYEIVVVCREPDDAPDLPEGAPRVVVRLDVVVAQGHSCPAEVSSRKIINNNIRPGFDNRHLIIEGYRTSVGL